MSEQRVKKKQKTQDISLTDRAGLTFNVSKVGSQLKTLVSEYENIESKRVKIDASIQMASVLEYLTKHVFQGCDGLSRIEGEGVSQEIENSGILKQLKSSAYEKFAGILVFMDGNLMVGKTDAAQGLVNSLHNEMTKEKAKLDEQSMSQSTDGHNNTTEGAKESFWTLGNFLSESLDPSFVG
eukprot:839111_1